jgi:2,3-bisphosphoglycerate-independent phosphoglycerate mutase
MKSKNKTCLIVLDGWGHGDSTKSDAIYMANTPFVDSLYKTVPHAELLTDGPNVGLPEGQMGNSEVGHMNIGAGRIVYQDLLRINNAVQDGSFFKQEVLLQAIHTAKMNGTTLHLMGLVSEGGVHSSQAHLHALLTLCKDQELTDVAVHAFTDGRDCDPKSGRECLQNLEKHMQSTTGYVASIIGRYFAMDRDKRWERVSKAFALLARGKGQPFTNVDEAMLASYNNKITDEFIEPTSIVDSSGKAKAVIQNGDVVLCFNFRTDRCREITEALTQRAFPDFGMEPLDLHYYTMTNYDYTYKNVQVVYDKDNLQKTLGEVIATQGLKQIRIAETEKYPHVTFFFSGGREELFEGEQRMMAHSPKVATYDLKPEMSAQEIVDLIVPELNAESPDFVMLNFANPDMVGHTGVFEAIVKAVETTDDCLRQVVEAGKAHDYTFIIIADHGNADKAVNPDGSPNTAHTTNPVPVFVIAPEVTDARNGVLADVAPTVLKIMGLKQPLEMTGQPLI